MSSTKSKYTGERPIVYKPSPRQSAIAQALAKAGAYTRAAENADAGGSGIAHE